MLTGARFGTSDIKRAIAFYDKVAAALGASRVIDRHGAVGYRGAEGGILMIGTPREGAASSGNGSQVMLAAPTRAAVDAAHAAALEMGGTCEGAPGVRGENRIYAAYFRDHDGNKVMVIKAGE